MTVTFRTVVTLEVTHEYYAGRCHDFDFLVPQSTALLLQRGRMLAKVLDDRLHLLVEMDDASQPMVNLAGRTLRFGLALKNPYFSNFTAPGTLPVSGLALYRRRAGIANLDAPVATTPLAPRFQHTPSRADRPLTLTVTGPDGRETAVRTVNVDSPASMLSFEFGGQWPGLYQFVEDYPAGVQATSLGYLDPGFTVTPSAAVEIDIDAGLYSAPQALSLTVPFTARTETLNYYVVVRDLTSQEFSQLTVNDQGPAPQLAFTRIESAAFTPAELSPSLLGNGDTRIVLFRSTTTTQRLARGRARLELRRNGVVLIPNLPQPGADRARADLIVHVSKKP